MSDKTNVHSGHRQRLRSTALTEGFDSFYPHQVMELLLFYSVPRRDVSELAHRLIDAFGSVHGVLTAEREQLLAIKGIGTKSVNWLLSMGEMLLAYGALNTSNKPCISNYRAAFDFCAKRQPGQAQPQCYQLCMSPGGIVLSYTKLCNSLEWAAPSTLKYALSNALTVHARNIILVEYLDALPEAVAAYDQKHVHEYAYTLRAMNAALVDVLLVSPEGTRSLSQIGMLKQEGFMVRSVFSERYLREDEAPQEFEY